MFRLLSDKLLHQWLQWPGWKGTFLNKSWPKRCIFKIKHCHNVWYIVLETIPLKYLLKKCRVPEDAQIIISRTANIRKMSVICAFILEIKAPYIPCNFSCISQQSQRSDSCFAEMLYTSMLMHMWNGGGVAVRGQLRPLPLQSELFDANRRNWNRAELNSLEEKKVSHRENKKTGGLREKRGRGGVNREEATGSRSWRSSSPGSHSPLLCPSHWVHVWHLTGVGPAPSMHSSCVCLSSHQPPPPFSTDRAWRRKRGECGGLRRGGSHRKTKVAPIEANAPDTPQFLHNTHTYTHSSFSPLCSTALTELDVREGWD